MPGLNSQSRGTDRISSELSFVLCLSLCYAIVFMLFCCYYVVLLLCCSVIICVILCIDRVYCTTATGVNPIAVDKYIYLSIIIIIIH